MEFNNLGMRAPGVRVARFRARWLCDLLYCSREDLRPVVLGSKG